MTTREVAVSWRHPFGLLDRKSTRLNSSHGYISYAVFCLKKKNNIGSSRCLSPRPHPIVRLYHALSLSPFIHLYGAASWCRPLLSLRLLLSVSSRRHRSIA